MAVTTAQYVTKSENRHRSKRPILANANLYGGTACFVDAAGFTEETTQAGANNFGGIVVETKTGSGTNGEINAEAYVDGKFWLPLSGATAADLKAKLYASDNYTFTTSAAGNTYVGTIEEVDVAGAKVFCLIDPQTP